MRVYMRIKVFLWCEGQGLKGKVYKMEKKWAGQRMQEEASQIGDDQGSSGMCTLQRS